MFALAHNGGMAMDRRREKGVYSKWVNDGSKDVTLRRMLKSTHQGQHRTGRSMISRICYNRGEVWYLRLLCSGWVEKHCSSEETWSLTDRAERARSRRVRSDRRRSAASSRCLSDDWCRLRRTPAGEPSNPRRSTAMSSVSVCLSVREHISGTSRSTIFTNFLCLLHTVAARLGRCDTLFASGFMASVTFAHKVTHQWTASDRQRSLIFTTVYYYSFKRNS